MAAHAGAIEYRLASRLDAHALAEHYARDRRLHIPAFLERECAAALAAWLAETPEWRRVLNAGDKLYELTPSDWAALPADKRAALDDAIARAARHSFQFRYETIRVPDGGAPPSPTPLDGLAAFLNSREMIAFFRTVLGAPAVDFADAQATAYGPGDFLTGHDDAVAGKNRLAAYVLGLTPAWRIEWGGLLLFHGADGHVERGITPGFNSLNLLGVPQPHSVSMVAPFAEGRRYAVTGWLRARG